VIKYRQENKITEGYLMKYGYMRVSTKDKQEFTRQEFALKEYKLDKIFCEKISGTKKACGREAFGEMLEVLVKGDEVYFESMSRMARSMQDLIDTTNFLVKKKAVKVIFIKENLTIGGNNGLDAMGALIFNIMGAFAQFERDLISDRTKQALSAKKEMGVVLGKPKTFTDEQRERVVELHNSGLSLREISKVCSISVATCGRIVKEYANDKS
jgi:DNA invertase Pin-like site-specific DNA recombinase